MGGFPAAIWTIFSRKKAVIHKDQLLRAAGRGDSYTENVHYEFRRSFSKLYYQYQPESYFWIELVIGRKFLLVLIGAIFRNNPSFQMASCLLVLFSSLVMQVHRQPFMGHRERAALVKRTMEHRILRMTKELSSMELLHAMEKDEEGYGTYEKNEERMEARRKQISQTQALMESQFKILHDQHRILCNYNVVEEVFLVCGVLVNLCGMMFDTEYLKNPVNKNVKKTVTYFVIVIIITSITYWFVVLLYEVCTGKRNKKTRSKLHFSKLKSSMGGGKKKNKKKFGGGKSGGGSPFAGKVGGGNPFAQIGKVAHKSKSPAALPANSGQRAAGQPNSLPTDLFANSDSSDDSDIDYNEIDFVVSHKRNDNDKRPLLKKKHGAAKVVDFDHLVDAGDMDFGDLLDEHDDDHDVLHLENAHHQAAMSSSSHARSSLRRSKSALLTDVFIDEDMREHKPHQQRNRTKVSPSARALKNWD